MNESEYGPRTRRRAGVAIAALLGFILALVPMTAAHAVPALGLTVTSPTLEDSFTLGETVTITWATNATVPLNIELMLADGTTKVMDIKTNVAAKPATYKWSIPMNDTVNLNPQVPGTFKVKISTASGPAKSDVSDDPFNIGYGAMSLSSPKVTDSWKGGDVGRIVKFDPKTATGLLAADLMDAAGTGVITANIKTGVQATAKQFSWDIPVNAVSASGSYKIRLRSANALVFGLSPLFTLAPPTIKVTSPDSTGITWAVGASQTVKWSAPFAGTVTIKLVDTVTPGNTTTVKTGVSAKAGQYVFLLPAATALATNTYKISVTSDLNTNVTDVSDNTFDVANPAVAVSNPNGTVVNAGERLPIKWSTQAVGKVRLELLDNSNGSLYNITPITGVTSVTTGTNTYNWDIPLGVITASGTYKIKASVVGQAFAGTSTFTLNVPTITLANPSNTGWDVGTQHAITWTTSSTFTGNVSLLLLNSPGLTQAAVIKASVAVRPTTFTWVVPHNLTPGSYVIRIASAGSGVAVNANVTDDSTAFTVGVPTVTIAAAGAPWTVGTRQTVTYSTAATGALKVNLLDNSNALVAVVKASVSATGTSFSWDIPLGVVTASGTYKLQATSTTAGGSQITGMSAGFTLTVPAITVTVPGTHTWTSPMAAQTVQWSGFSTGTVKVTLTNNTTQVVTTLKASVSASLGTTTVTVPTGLVTAAGGYTLAVTSTANPGITGTVAITI